MILLQLKKLSMKIDYFVTGFNFSKLLNYIILKKSIFNYFCINNLISNFYLTNSISRASIMMHKLGKQINYNIL